MSPTVDRIPGNGSNAVSGLIGRVPDIPRWVEARGMLLCGRCEVFGAGASGFVVRSTTNKLVSVVGKPAGAAILEAVSRTGEGVELLVTPEDRAELDHSLENWVTHPAILHDLATTPSAVVEEDDIRFLGHVPEGLPSSLHSEIESAIPWHPIVAALVDGKPVSFCYAAAETETLWDVSVDTLEPYRRRGYAARCVTWLIHYMAAQGKAPVWGALEDNPASLNLAKKLNFRPVGRLFIFTPPENSPFLRLRDLDEEVNEG